MQAVLRFKAVTDVSFQLTMQDQCHWHPSLKCIQLPKTSSRSAAEGELGHVRCLTVTILPPDTAGSRGDAEAARKSIAISVTFAHGPFGMLTVRSSFSLWLV